MSIVREVDGALGAKKAGEDEFDGSAGRDSAFDDPRMAGALYRTSLLFNAELDFEKLVSRILAEAASSCGARVGAFFYRSVSDSSADANLCAFFGHSDVGAPPWQDHREELVTLFRDERVLRIADAQREPFAASLLQRLGIRSYLAALIVSRAGSSLGALHFGHPEAGVFTARHEKFLVSLAAQASIALENARLLADARETQRVLSRQARGSALRADIGAALTRAASVDEALSRCSEALVRHLDAAFARIWTLNEKDQVLELVASSGMYTHIDGPHSRVPVGAFKIGLIAQEREPHLTNDVLRDPRVGDPAWAAREKLVSFAGYPLLRGARVLGVVALFARIPLTPDTLDDLAFVADLIALSIDRARADDALRSSEGRHRLFAESTNEGIWYWDIAINRFEYNDRLLEIVGLGRDEWGGGYDDFLARVHESDRPLMQASLDAHLQRGQVYELEFRLRNSSGDYRRCRTRGKAQRGADGKPVAMAAGVSDVTEALFAKEALARSEERYRTLVEASSAIVWTMPPEGRFASEQTQWTGFTGQPTEALVGEGWLDAIHPESREATKARWTAAVESSAACEIEHRLRRRDGEYRVMSMRAMPVRREDGAVREWVGVHRDVTEQRSADAERTRLFQAVQEREAQLRDLVENLPELAWSAQPDGSVDYYNRRWYDYTGTTLESMKGWGWKAVHHPSTLDAVVEAWIRSISTGEPFEMEFPLRAADGAYQWFLTRVNPVRDAAGNILRWFGTNTNIQGRKRSEAEREKLISALASTNAELDMFAYVASHDLKAPLRGIANLSQWVEEDLADAMTEDARKNMALLRGRVHRLEALIDGILSYSRAGRLQAKLDWVDSGEVLREAIELLAPPSSASVTVSPSLPRVRAERVQFQQVFLNLVSNALKHGGPNVRVDVSAKEQGEGWEFRVKDDGPGIAPEYHERIWNIFQTLQPRDRVEGTGIGLSVVKKIVESRGGSVGIESREGAGTTFVVWWPKEPKAAT